MKVLLINPPWYRLLGWTFSGVPLGLAYLAGALEKGGHDVSIYNPDAVKSGLALPFSDYVEEQTYEKYKHALTDISHPIWDEIKRTLSSIQPDVVGISVRTTQYPSALMVSRLVKELSPDVPVIWGGVHPTVMDTECLENKDVDFVVRGEGESTIVELLDNLKRPDNVLGITYKGINRIIHNPNRPFIANLDDIPFPARHKVIGWENLQPESFGYLFASRGCPFSCAFCASHLVWSRRVRYRTVTNIINEIVFLKNKYKTNNFYFVDDSFNANKVFAEDFCKSLINMKLDITWHCSTRVDLVTPEIIALMKASGVAEISLGIESGSSATLKRIQKGITVEQVMKAVSIIKHEKVQLGANFIIGFPWETKEDVNATLSLVKEVDADTVGIYMATPFPGTEIYQICKDEGLLPPKIDYSSFFLMRPDFCLSHNISKEEMIEIIKRGQEMMGAHNRRKFRQFALKHPFYALKRFISGKYYYPGSLKAILRQLR